MKITCIVEKELVPLVEVEERHRCKYTFQDLKEPGQSMFIVNGNHGSISVKCARLRKEDKDFVWQHAEKDGVKDIRVWKKT